MAKVCNEHGCKNQCRGKFDKCWEHRQICGSLILGTKEICQKKTETKCFYHKRAFPVVACKKCGIGTNSKYELCSECSTINEQMKAYRQRLKNARKLALEQGLWWPNP